MDRNVFALPVVLALALVSCGQNSVGPSDLNSTDALVRALKQRGVTVVLVESMPQSAYPFFSVAAQRVTVNGEEVQVFECADVSRANSEAGRVSPTGSPIGQSQISWMDIPHFYKRDLLIVLYVGHSASVLKVLETTLGPPFASGR
jgi:hypothetical protein